MNLIAVHISPSFTLYPEDFKNLTCSVFLQLQGMNEWRSWPTAHNTNHMPLNPR